MKVIIAGGREYKFTKTDIEALDELKHIITEVVCGEARGADTEGKYWANSHNIPVKSFPADWSKGRGAGFLRNQEMADYSDACILFRGNKGTQDMFRRATKGGLTVLDWREVGNELFG